MAFINRRGDTYYAFQGATKTGKAKYFASKKASSEKAALVEELPAEFEYYENPVNATVVIRRRKPSLVTVAERNLLSRLALELCSVRCEVTIDGNSLVVYAGATPRTNPELIFAMPNLSQQLERHANLEPGFRFTIVNAEERQFIVERYCYRSAIDGWMKLQGKSASLQSLATKYLSHLGDESFFELF